MSLLNKYNAHDSSYSPSPSDPGRIRKQANVEGATKQSKLHALPTGAPGYSLDGAFYSDVNQDQQKYDNGVDILLPSAPSSLDDFSHPKYENVAPEGRGNLIP